MSYNYNLHTKSDHSGSISLLSFRHGEGNYNSVSSPGKNSLSTQTIMNLFGHPRGDVLEGKGLFYRDFLRDTCAHM